MATYLHDIGSSLVGNASIVPAGARTANTAGVGVDLLAGDGTCNVIVEAGVVTDGTWTITVQESTDNATWTAITMAGTLSTLTSATASGFTQAAVFNRTKRYCVANATQVNASSGACFSVAIVEQKKFVV